jgi:hypothetical protein
MIKKQKNKPCMKRCFFDMKWISGVLFMKKQSTIHVYIYFTFGKACIIINNNLIYLKELLIWMKYGRTVKI